MGDRVPQGVTQYTSLRVYLRSLIAADGEIPRCCGSSNALRARYTRNLAFEFRAAKRRSQELMKLAHVSSP